jgi:hypothetical protein
MKNLLLLFVLLFSFPQNSQVTPQRARLDVAVVWKGGEPIKGANIVLSDSSGNAIQPVTRNTLLFDLPNQFPSSVKVRVTAPEFEDAPAVDCVIPLNLPTGVTSISARILINERGQSAAKTGAFIINARTEGTF